MHCFASQAVREALSRDLDRKTRWVLSCTEIELRSDEIIFHCPSVFDLVVLVLAFAASGALHTLQTIGCPTDVDFHFDGKSILPYGILGKPTKKNNDTDTDDYQFAP